jgi:hypothetical protein
MQVTSITFAPVGTTKVSEDVKTLVAGAKSPPKADTSQVPLVELYE